MHAVGMSRAIQQGSKGEVGTKKCSGRRDGNTALMAAGPRQPQQPHQGAWRRPGGSACCRWHMAAAAEARCQAASSAAVPSSVPRGDSAGEPTACVTSRKSRPSTSGAASTRGAATRRAATSLDACAAAARSHLASAASQELTPVVCSAGAGAAVCVPSRAPRDPTLQRRLFGKASGMPCKLPASACS